VPIFRSLPFLLSFLICGFAPSTQAAEPQEVRLIAALSMVSSGLLDQVLPAFTFKTGIKVKVRALGAADALAAAAKDEADLLLVHDPEAEAAFVAAGHGITPKEIAWNDLLLIGPASLTKSLKTKHSAVAAFRAIADQSLTFVTRDDKSGTDTLEKRIWVAADIEPKGAPWYHVADGGSAKIIDTAVATHGIILVDRSNWLAWRDRRDLTTLVEGDSLFINRYDVIEMNPAKHRNLNLAPAKLLAQWLSSPEGQEVIGSVMLEDQQLFHPDAAHPFPRN
jgi:tungstate transport system substrate-binding protein